MISVGESLKNSDVTYKQRMADIDRDKQIEAEQRFREHASPYKNFVQLNEEMIDCLCALNAKSSVALSIWLFLVKRCNPYNAVACSSKVLEEALGYSRTSVYEGIKVLKESNFIGVKKMGTANVYLLNRDVTWKSWGTNYKYAEFGAKILLAESEQEKMSAVKNERIIMPVIRHKEDSKQPGKDS